MKTMDQSKLHELAGIERSLLTLNYRLTLRAANAWRGNAPPRSEYDLYEGFHELLNPDVILQFRESGIDSWEKKRMFHSLLGHYIQYRVLPLDNELSMWSRRAAAEVNGEKIYFKDILTWCQKHSNLEKRRIIVKETSSLSKFLKPFAMSSWELVLELIEEEFGYGDYIEYCRDKKGIDYGAYTEKVRAWLRQSHDLYFSAMEAWASRSFGLSLTDLNRFDAIYMLALSEFEGLYPDRGHLEEHLDFFHSWAINVKSIPGLNLDISHSPKKGSQAMTFALRVPDEIVLVMNPQGGWLDLETLFHEMGHALSNVFTSPELAPPAKDFYPSNVLSETYAFLLQNMCFSPLFLERKLELKPPDIETIMHYKALKDLSFFRRYAAKFLAEYEMFKGKDLANGGIYAHLLKECTGFSYRPETHLFDLVPEFYSLDYVFSWMAEATMAKALSETLGADWMFKREAWDILKGWWSQGNRYDLEEFFLLNRIGSLNFDDVMERWRARISRSEAP